MKLTKQIVLLALLCPLQNVNAQKYVNAEWNYSGGNVGQYDYVSCAKDANGNIIMVGNRNLSNYSSILTSRVNPQGISDWQQLMSGAGNFDHYGIDLAVTSTGHVVVIAAVHNGSDYDYRINKYTSGGNLVWFTDYNGNGNSDDVPISLVLDATDNVYVTGTTLDSITLANYTTLKLDSAGTILWDVDYDNNSTIDVAVDMIMDSNGDLVIAGSSSSSMIDADITVVKYSSSGSFIAANRYNSTGNGFDFPTEMVVDANDNVHIVGTANSNQSNRDIEIISFDNSLTMNWVQYIDRAGAADEGFSMCMHPNGNVLITGYSTKTSGGTDCVTGMYNPSTGAAIWVKEKTAVIDNQYSKGRKVRTDNSGNIYVASEADFNGSRDIFVTGYDANGKVTMEVSYNNSSNGTDRPFQMLVDGNEIYVTGLCNHGATDSSVLIKYTISEKIIDPVYVNGVASYNNNELILRFHPSALILDNIDDKTKTFGTLGDFVKNPALGLMSSKYNINWRDMPAYKIHLGMTSADTLSISRTGDTIKMPPFWATLSVMLDREPLEIVIDSLTKLYPIIGFAEVNAIGHLMAAPNDAEYALQQLSLYDFGVGVDVEDAWDIQTGQTFIKAGVYDSGVNWDHEDFGDGTSSGTKVVNGWDFVNQTSIFTSNQHDSQGHGTAVAGIIGALRNNSLGVAGIAGGDMSVGNTGIDLYSFKITNGGINDPILISSAASAIVAGATDYINGYGYGLEIQNHSWATNQPTAQLGEAVRECFRNSCFFVSSSGNFVNSALCPTQDCILYPASYYQYWVYKVGATDSTGGVASFSVIDNFVDAVAPGTKNLYTCVDDFNDNGYTDLFSSGDEISGTSFAAPHAAGIAGLLLSEHHPNNGYSNVLAPEDLEAMMNSFRVDLPPAGYDAASGHGRLDAQYALSKCTLPDYYILHNGVNASPSTSMINNVTVVLPYNMQGLAAGWYVADKYQVTHTYQNTLPAGHSFLSSWPRYSSSEGVSSANPISDNTWLTISSSVSGNVVTTTATTNCWFVQSALSGQIVNTWIPCPPTDLKTAISLYIEDTNATGVPDIDNQSEVSIFPNPTDGSITVQYMLAGSEKIMFDVYDVTGKLIKQNNFGNQSPGQNVLHINIEDLSTGMYVCKLHLGDKVFTKSLIKY